jgi:hypothetical protein
VGAVLESVAQVKSAKSAAGAGDESGLFLVLSLVEKTIGPDNGALNCRARAHALALLAIPDLVA